jgi:DNA/RNA endonuclease G (NUC1)
MRNLFNKYPAQYLSLLIIVGIVLLLLGASRCTGQQVVIQNHAYKSYWNAKTLIPDSVIWICSPHNKVAKRCAGFHATGNRQNLSRDYAHSGFDIGHCADADDCNGSIADEYDSFDFTNVMPQKPNCNRITWLALENYTRSLNKPVRVKVWWIGIDGYLGADRVAIPSYCCKSLTYGGKTETYVIPNADTCIRHKFAYYRVK